MWRALMGYRILVPHLVPIFCATWCCYVLLQDARLYEDSNLMLLDAAGRLRCGAVKLAWNDICQKSVHYFDAATKLVKSDPGNWWRKQLATSIKKNENRCSNIPVQMSVTQSKKMKTGVLTSPFKCLLQNVTEMTALGIRQNGVRTILQLNFTLVTAKLSWGLLAQHMFSLLGAGHFAGPCWIYISLLSSKSFSPGVSYQRIFQECLPRVSSQECPPRVSVQERLTKASFKSIVFSSSGSVFQECLWRMSHKSVFQECLPRVSKQECLPRASSTIVCFHLFPNPAWQHLTTYWC